jgi:hypothetical protein
VTQRPAATSALKESTLSTVLSDTYRRSAEHKSKSTDAESAPDTQRSGPRTTG